MKRLTSAALLLAVLTVICCIGCTHPVYFKKIETAYDASGKMTGRVITESITQTDPVAASLQVNITEPIDRDHK